MELKSLRLPQLDATRKVCDGFCSYCGTKTLHEFSEKKPKIICNECRIELKLRDRRRQSASRKEKN